MVSGCPGGEPGRPGHLASRPGVAIAPRGTCGVVRGVCGGVRGCWSSFPDARRSSGGRVGSSGGAAEEVRAVGDRSRSHRHDLTPLRSARGSDPPTCAAPRWCSRARRGSRRGRAASLRAACGRVEPARHRALRFVEQLRDLAAAEGLEPVELEHDLRAQRQGTQRGEQEPLLAASCEVLRGVANELGMRRRDESGELGQELLRRHVDEAALATRVESDTAIGEVRGVVLEGRAQQVLARVRAVCDRGRRRRRRRASSCRARSRRGRARSRSRSPPVA